MPDYIDFLLALEYCYEHSPAVNNAPHAGENH